MSNKKKFYMKFSAASANKKQQSKLMGEELQYYAANAIPQYIAQPVQTRVFRFINTQGILAGTYIIGRGDLLGLVGAQSVAGATAVYMSIFDSIRLNSVKVWGQPYLPVAAQGTGFSSTLEGFGSISVTFSGLNAPTKTFSDTGSGVNRPYISCKPPKESFASFWTNQASNASEVLFELTCSSGDIIDISVSYVLLNGASAFSFAGTALVSGLYYSSLDQATSVLKPVTNQWDGA